MLIRSKTKCTREYIDAAPNLKLIIRGGVGIDNIDMDYARTRASRSSTRRGLGIAVAELAFALMIAVPNRHRRRPQHHAEGEWLKKELKRTELYGKTLGWSASATSAPSWPRGPRPSA